MPSALILDLDGSLAGLEGRRLDLAHWQERIRFGCGLRTWGKFAAELEALLPAAQAARLPPVMLGSGDFHHVSHLLIRRLAGPLDVVVLDNHPDNMRFPFGIHCGSWVRHVAGLPQVRRVHVLGITSNDVAAGHAWENYLRPLYRGKVHYWTLGVDTGWAARIGLRAAVHAYAAADDMVSAFLDAIGADSLPVYLSIDKDVFSTAIVQTNWDQGCLQLAQAGRLIDALGGHAAGLAGCDITGEVSQYRYGTPWKRLLSGLDRQPQIAAGALAAMQARHMMVNRELLARIEAAGG